MSNFHAYLGDDFKVEFPTRSGNYMTLRQVLRELSRRMASLFLQDDSGKRPVFGQIKKFQSDPHWKDHIYFHEYFHGDEGAGLGASHQTGWTGLVAHMIQVCAEIDDSDEKNQANASG